MPRANAWEDLAGRPARGVMATRAADVSLLVAEALATRKLPASLAPGIVALAMQDVLDAAHPAYFDDWSGFTRAAAALPAAKLDDYIAALDRCGPAHPRASNRSLARTTMTLRGDVSLAVAIAAVLAIPPTASTTDQAPTLHISAPTEGTYASGPTRLVAIVEPAPRAGEVSQVTFFADGHQVCVVPKPPFQCDWDAGERLVEHQVRAVALLASGDRLVDTVRTQGLQYSEGVDVDVVQVTAVVTDGGRFVSGLRQSDFRVFEDDRPQTITNFASENIPLELVAAIDVSSSMTEALPLVKESAKRFLAGLRPNDQVTVLGFNDNIFTLARRATDQGARVRAIDRMAPWGGTALYDVTIKAIDLLGRQQGRRSIVIFSDGDDQSSHAPIDAAIARAEGSDATIYAIGQGRAVRASNLQDLLRRFATISGGRAFFTDDVVKLGAVFDEILEDLRNQYLLSYPAPSTQRDGAWHRIRVEVVGRQVSRPCAPGISTDAASAAAMKPLATIRPPGVSADRVASGPKRAGRAGSADVSIVCRPGPGRRERHRQDRTARDRARGRRLRTDNRRQGAEDCIRAVRHRRPRPRRRPLRPTTARTWPPPAAG